MISVSESAEICSESRSESAGSGIAISSGLRPISARFTRDVELIALDSDRLERLDQPGHEYRVLVTWKGGELAHPAPSLAEQSRAERRRSPIAEIQKVEAEDRGWSRSSKGGFGVDLIGTYSNDRSRADLLIRTRRWLSKGRRAAVEDPRFSVRAKPGPVAPRRVTDRLGDEIVRELTEARRAGAKLSELVERYEVSESSLKRVLRAAADDLQCDDYEGRGRDPHR